MEAMTRDNPDFWIDQVFSAKAAVSGGVVRRSTVWVAREIGQDRFIDEVRQRGFHLLEAAGQYIVICRRGAIRKIV